MSVKPVLEYIHFVLMWCASNLWVIFPNLPNKRFLSEASKQSTAWQTSPSCINPCLQIHPLSAEVHSGCVNFCCWTSPSLLNSGRVTVGPASSRSTHTHWEAFSDLQIFITQFCCVCSLSFSLSLLVPLRICTVNNVRLYLRPESSSSSYRHWKTSCIMFLPMNDFN